MGGPTYDRMAPVYQRIADAYSLGCVPHAKGRQLSFVEPGMRVLYAGVGPGSAALDAARRGADVTGIDLSPRMIDVASRRFDAAGEVAELRVDDVLAYDPDRPFDIVVANFLLDCFDDGTRSDVAQRLHGFLDRGGKVLVADTGRPRGSLMGRASWYLYHGIAYATTWIQGITPFVPVMDLDACLGDAGFAIDEHVVHRPWRGGPVLFESIVGTRP